MARTRCPFGRRLTRIEVRVDILLVALIAALIIALLLRATARRREEDPNAVMWGTPAWLLGGLFFWNHGGGMQPPEGAQDPNGVAGLGDFGGIGGNDLGGNNLGGGGGDFGGGSV